MALLGGMLFLEKKKKTLRCSLALSLACLINGFHQFYTPEFNEKDFRKLSNQHGEC